MAFVSSSAALATERLASGASAVQPSSPDDKVRCRRIAITGSLIKAEKVCKTVGEWRRLADRGNDAVRDIMSTNTLCTGGECRGIEPQN